MKLKRGHVDESGRVFWGRHGKAEGGREIWMRDMAAFEARKAKRAKVVASWYSRNKPVKLVTDRRWRKKEIETNPVFRLGRTLRSRLAVALKRNRIRKSQRTACYLGASVEEVRQHIEKQFLEGMTWDNHGTVWHIDHRKPLASASTVEEVIALCHFTNLQPLWAKDNLRKGAKFLT